jgi:hypothetical protein
MVPGVGQRLAELLASSLTDAAFAGPVTAAALVAFSLTVAMFAEPLTDAWQLASSPTADVL